MAKTQTYVQRAIGYAREVVSGKISACHWVKRACQRQLDDLERWKGKDAPYRWRPEKANEICEFIELLPHVKGEWAKRREKLRLEDWQCFELTTIFGWYRTDGLRRFRTVYLEEPRKNAKSTKSAGVGLYMLTADGEAGAEIYSAATTRDQTRPVFAECAREMALREPDFREVFGVNVGAHNISVPTAASKFEALSADASTLDGLNIHCAIVDELHAHPTRKVWDVLETATGARSQPLLWAITTAGTDKTGICYEQRTYVTKILNGLIQDETYFGIIYTIDEGDDPFDPATWRKANPNYGISVKADDLERKAAKARQLPAALSNFLTKHLNVWVSADAGLYDMLAWGRAADSALNVDALIGVPCWLAIDLGFVDDIASWVALFKRESGYAVVGRHYLPEETVQESRNSQYGGWQRSGWITATDGNITSIGEIMDDIVEFFGRHNVQEIAFDPYNKLTLLSGDDSLTRRGIPAEKLVEFPQTIPTMSPATEALIKAVKSEEIRHNGDPVLAWAMSNAVGRFDAKGNVYPRKERPENKIDPAIALTMAYGRCLAAQNNTIGEMLVI